MRIAFLHIENNPHVISRIKYFLSNGHDVFYFGLPPWDRKSRKSKTPVGAISISITPKKNILSQIISKIKLGKALLNIYKIRCLVNKHKIDILHIMWMSNGIYAPFAKPQKIVFENMGSDVIFMPKKSWIWRKQLNLYYRFGDAVIQDSRVAQECGIKYGAPAANNEIIEVGVDFSIFNLEVEKGVAREKLNLKNNQKLVFSPRSFQQIYNIDVIIKSISIVRQSFPDVVFAFCTFAGTMENQYKQLIKLEGVEENIVFTGFLDNETELPSYFSDADAVVSVPVTDSSPKSVYEAMACGAPVIISELPWYHGKFLKNKEVAVVPVGDVEKLAETVISILNKDTILDISAAYNKVFKDINQDSENQKLETLYQKLLPN
jgi:glycosyltransferase involved in cell wall biosynthesis